MMLRVLLAVFFSVQILSAVDLSSSITFAVYPESGEEIFIAASSKQQLTELGCSKDEKFTMIVHGWLESCKREWIVELRKNLKSARGGCIICMDYSTHSVNLNYFYLVTQFKDIKNVLVDRLKLMDEEGFNFDNGFMFGFSFGGHVALESAIELGVQRFRMIDICEKAGPGFNDKQLNDPKLAAKNVQCIHTSLDKGMQVRNCHQNWSMGNCGLNQPAAGFYPKGSHGLCPYFYNSAFNNEFFAISKPGNCFANNAPSTWPPGYKMGYWENRTSDVQGEFFAETSRANPYNVIHDFHRMQMTSAAVETTTIRPTISDESTTQKDTDSSPVFDWQNEVISFNF